MLDGPWADWLRWSDPVPETFLGTSVGPSYSRGEGQRRATVMALLLGFLVVLIFFITLSKIRSGMH